MKAFQGKFLKFVSTIQGGLIPTVCILSDDALFRYYKVACQLCLTFRQRLITLKQTDSPLYRHANDCYARLRAEYHEVHYRNEVLPISVPDQTDADLRKSLTGYFEFLKTTSGIRVYGF